MPDRTSPPPIKDAIEFDIKLPPCTSGQLKNNVPYYLFNEGAEDVVQIEWVFEAGNVFEHKSSIAAITNSLIKSGTSKKNSFEIAEFFEFYGAYISFACYNEFSVITLHSLTRYVKDLLPIIRELITDATFPEHELDIFKQNAIQGLSINLLKCDFVANRLMNEYLYGKEHPYGRSSSEESIRSATRDDLQQFYNQFYKNGKCRIFAAGKLPEHFEQMMENYFGDLPIFSSLPTQSWNREISSERKFRIMNDASGVQGAIRIARPFPNRHHPDFQKVKVLNTVFGGYFGSRLMTTIREEKGYTYGISSYLQDHVSDTSWLVSTEAGKDVCEDAVKEIYNEMKRLQNEVVDEEELLLVKNYLMGIYLADLDGAFNVMARWKGLILHGLDEQYFYETIRTIKTITPNELQELAIKYLNPKDFIELVVI